MQSGVRNGCLAVTYFHMGIHTIIGAESFHGPVRDGKAWDQLAMAAKLKLLQIGKALINYLVMTESVSKLLSLKFFK